MKVSYEELVVLIQGTYFLITGLWPLIHYPSFVFVTGSKTDDWLVKTVGVLVSVIGYTLVLSALRHNLQTEILLLAIGSALGLMIIDIFYVLRKRIAPVYLFDALVELSLITSLLLLHKSFQSS